MITFEVTFDRMTVIPMQFESWGELVAELIKTGRIGRVTGIKVIKEE